jgi:epoxyqueuosine reductase
MHGGMGWMEARADQRADPCALWPEARSVIALGLSYAPETDPLESLAWRDRATISVYARNRDYHDVVKKRLKALARWIVAQYADAGVKVFVDTAPVMEKPLAQQAGLGWQGKHTNLVSRSHGSWLFLGEIYTTLDLRPDASEVDHCGTCTRCLDICPTRAFPAPYRLDARRCISYLTIEHHGPIPSLWAIASMAAMIALRSAPGINSRACIRNPPLRRAPNSPRQGLPHWRRWMMQLSAHYFPAAPSSASGAIASSAMC